MKWWRSAFLGNKLPEHSWVTTEEIVAEIAERQWTLAPCPNFDKDAIWIHNEGAHDRIYYVPEDE